MKPGHVGLAGLCEGATRVHGKSLRRWNSVGEEIGV